MFWGPKDTSVSFCENKYEKVEWIAEFYNTITSLFYCVVGIVFYKYFKKLTNIGISLIMVGIGSVLLHMTMKWWGQWFDEISMLALCFYATKSIKKNIKDYFLIPIIFIYTLLSEYFLYFVMVFTFVQIYLAYEAFKMIKDKKKHLYQRISLIIYITSFSMGTICWITDQVFCSHVEFLQLHAWWHFFTSTAAFFGFLSIA